VFNVNTGQYPCNVSSEEEQWWSGDPFWNLVERNNKISNILLWPGNELTINGQQPTNHWDYGEHGEGKVKNYSLFPHKIRKNRE